MYRRVSRGGGARDLPPQAIAKQKKRSSEQILSYFTYCSYFFSRKCNFLIYFLSWAPPEKKAFKILPPPLYEFLDTRLVYYHRLDNNAQKILVSTVIFSLNHLHNLIPISHPSASAMTFSLPAWSSTDSLFTISNLLRSTCECTVYNESTCRDTED